MLLLFLLLFLFRQSSYINVVAIDNGVQWQRNDNTVGYKNQILASGQTIDLTFVVFLSFVLFMFIYLMPSYRI